MGPSQETSQETISDVGPRKELQVKMENQEWRPRGGWIRNQRPQRPAERQPQRWLMSAAEVQHTRTRIYYKMKTP